MESTFVWILMFAGAAVALLGVFLVAAERELKVKRREIETLLLKLESLPQDAASTPSTEPVAEPAELAELRAQNHRLQNELNTLSNELERSRHAVAELHASQQHNANSRIENQELSAANTRLSRELDELGSRLAAAEAQINGSQGLEQEAHARTQAELAEIRRALSESHAKIRDLENAQQNLPDVSAIEAAHRQERESLEQRIAEITQQASRDREKLAELQTLRDRLAESESIQNELRDEIRRHEEERSRWQARIAAGEESLQRLAALQAPYNEILAKQAALADRQNQLQEEMVAFGRQIGQPAGDLVSTAVAGGGAAPSASAPGPFARGPLDGSPELHAAQGMDAESESKEAPASRGTRYGILAGLLLSAGASFLAFQLFMADSEQAPEPTATEKNTPAPSALTQRSEPAEIAPQEPPVEASAEPASPGSAKLAAAGKEISAPAEPPKSQAERARPGTYRVIRTTRVYAAPTEISRSIGDIEPGVNVNVVDSRDGWLEIHSKHGRPPGFIRREAAARVGGPN